MKKAKLVIIVLAAVMMLALAGCPTEQQQGNKTVIDHAGNEVLIYKENLERVVVLDIYPLVSVLSVFFNSAESIVGMSNASMTAAANGVLAELYPEILDTKVIKDDTNVNVEELMLLEPDIVFYSAGNPQLGAKLKKAGIPAYAISPGKWGYDAIETLNQWIKSLAEIFPAQSDRVENVKTYSENSYNLVQGRVKDIPENEKERLFFLFQYSGSMITTSGKKFFGQWWAEAVGAINVGGVMETDNSTAVTMEQIYAWNPDRILITNFTSAQPDDLYNNTIGNYDWSVIDAVINKKVSKMPLGMYRSYTCGADTPVTLLWLAKTVYPELFKDIDITAETIKYYKEAFGITLTQKQAEKIFAPESDASAFG